MARKTAVQKRDTHRPPEVQILAVPKGPSYPAGRMLIASPLVLQVVVARIPAGRVMTSGALRGALAAAHGADYTCPLTTGIFLRIVAEAALEEAEAGVEGSANGVPWWRVVKDDGSMQDRLPGGPEHQAARLVADGFEVANGGSRRLKGRLRLTAVATLAWTPVSAVPAG